MWALKHQVMTLIYTETIKMFCICEIIFFACLFPSTWCTHKIMIGWKAFFQKESRFSGSTIFHVKLQWGLGLKFVHLGKGNREPGEGRKQICYQKPWFYVRYFENTLSGNADSIVSCPLKAYILMVKPLLLLDKEPSVRLETNIFLLAILYIECTTKIQNKVHSLFTLHITVSKI